MSLLGNLIWLIFGGFICGLGWIVGGLVICATIVGIPFGVQCIKIGIATFAPFGKEVVEDPTSGGPLQLALNILWIVLAGWELAIAHLVFALALALTIVGLPFAKQHLKLAMLTFVPFGRYLG